VEVYFFRSKNTISPLVYNQGGAMEHRSFSGTCSCIESFCLRWLELAHKNDSYNKKAKKTSETG